MSTIAAIPESAAQHPGDLRHIRRFNDALGTAVRRHGPLAWERSGRGWGTLRTQSGTTVCADVTVVDALESAAGVVS